MPTRFPLYFINNTSNSTIDVLSSAKQNKQEGRKKFRNLINGGGGQNLRVS